MGEVGYGVCMPGMGWGKVCMGKVGEVYYGRVVCDDCMYGYDERRGSEAMDA